MITLPENRFSSFDSHFATFLCRMEGTENQELFLAAALVNEALRNGHVCIDLNQIEEYNSRFSPSEQIKTPPAQTWIKNLALSYIVGKPGDYRPLILDSGKLYLYRYWNYEQQLAALLLDRSVNRPPLSIIPEIKRLNTIFPDQTETNWQKVAAVVALFNSFTCISGGPGTGKTTTVARLLTLLQTCSEKPLRIALCAPTGKAAARLNQSIASAYANVYRTGIIPVKLPDETYTIHRLLVPVPDSPYFQFNHKNHLPFDIVLVDEASMVDLALMTKLVSAVPKSSRLIFLGDKDQLSSVEAGAVLGDICDTGTEHTFTIEQSGRINSVMPEFTHPGNALEPPISDTIVSLRKSYRFSDSSAIGNLSRAIRNGNSEEMKKVLRSSTQNECHWENLPSSAVLREHLQKIVESSFIRLSSQTHPLDALKILDQFRILCASRQGFYGVESINRYIGSILVSMGIISYGETLYKGLPLMITGNDYALNLYNGDTGLIFPDPENTGGLKAIFRAPDGTCKSYIPRQIRSWETAYAMTVHKSQGSEFDEILLILPPVPNPVLTRELLYTAVTRARKKVIIWSTEAILERTVDIKTTRNSGLRDLLWRTR